MKNNTTKVSVIMLAYNHEPFIEQALNSVLEQETNFPYEILIGDDSSTDKTSKIIEEYANRGYEKHEPNRKKKLLLTRHEINKIIGAMAKKGYSLVAKKLFFDARGRAKLEIGLGKGKKLYDKRESIKERDISRKLREW